MGILIRAKFGGDAAVANSALTNIESNLLIRSY
jgi:hypothetical protein